MKVTKTCYCGKTFEADTSINGTLKAYCSAPCRKRSPQAKKARKNYSVKEIHKEFIDVGTANVSLIRLLDGRVVEVRKTKPEEFRTWYASLMEEIITRTQPSELVIRHIRSLIHECEEIEICGNSRWYFIEETNHLASYKKSGLQIFVSHREDRSA